MAILIKDAAEILDYTRDWGPELAADDDEIDTSEWRIPGSLDDEDDPVPGWLQFGPAADTHTTTTATVWLQGGTAGAEYDVINLILTAAGRTFERTFPLYVREK